MQQMSELMKIGGRCYRHLRGGKSILPHCVKQCCWHHPPHFLDIQG